MNEDSETYLNDDVDDDCFINTDDENLHDSGSTAAAENNTGDSQLNSIYLELAEKEEALLLAAQFGKTLIDEKEELERQLDTLKRDQHSQLETYEQETYQLKRLIESMKNEYESKIYELNDDVCILSKKIKQYERNVNLSSSSYEIHNEELELIQELKDRNLALVSQLNSSESQLSSVNENNLALENKIDAKEKVIDENAKLLSSYQKEISKLMKKQQEMEYVLMQTCNEKEKQTNILEELSNKYILLENDKNELENVIYQHENEIYNLRQINKNMLIKLEKYEYPITTSKCDKRRSVSVAENNAIKKNISSKDFASHTTQFNHHHQHHNQSATAAVAESSDSELDQKMITNSSTNSNDNLNDEEGINSTCASYLPPTALTAVAELSSSPLQAQQPSCSNDSVDSAGDSPANIFNFLNTQTESLTVSNYKNFSFSGSNLDDDDDDNDYDVEDSNYLEFVKNTEIEDDDEIVSDDMFLNSLEHSHHMSHRPIFVSWQQESTHENLIGQDDGQNTDDDDDECLDQQPESSDEPPKCPANSSSIATNQTELVCLQRKRENMSLFDEMNNSDTVKSQAPLNLKLKSKNSDNEQKENQFRDENGY